MYNWIHYINYTINAIYFKWFKLIILTFCDKNRERLKKMYLQNSY